MMNKSGITLLVTVLVVIGLALCTFTVSQTEQAIKFRFGEVVGADYAPGLHFMLPFVNNVRKFERRILTNNYPTERFLTSEGKILLIDFYAKFRINNVKTYYQATLGGNEMVAASRISESVKDGIKNLIANRTIQQVVAADRSEFITELLSVTGAKVNPLGIELIDVRVKKINLPDEVSGSVYSRMRQDFARQASQLRAEGEGAAEQIRSEADRERTEILANAYRDAEVIRGEGDSQAAAIFAKAYGKNPDFYAFYRSLEAYRAAIGKEDDVLVLSPDSDFFKYMKKSTAH